jgi:GNAT superfamily N-acetyltransferase
MKVRRAIKSDCPRMLELVRELAEYEKALHEVDITLKEMEEAGFGEKPVYWAFVAEDRHQVVGFALYYIRYSTWKGQRIYLEDILVTEAHRGKGIGKLLFDVLIREADEKGFSGITWQVLNWNIPAIHFYKKYNASLDDEWTNGALSREQIKNYLNQ